MAHTGRRNPVVMAVKTRDRVARTIHLGMIYLGVAIHSEIVLKPNLSCSEYIGIL
jgi:hypothetical protein